MTLPYPDRNTIYSTHATLYYYVDKQSKRHEFISCSQGDLPGFWRCQKKDGTQMMLNYSEIKVESLSRCPPNFNPS